MATTDTDRTPVILENGDHLTSDEFLEIYEQLPNAKNAELVQGVVNMGSPVSNDGHGKPHAHLMTWVGVYSASHPVLNVYDNSTVLFDEANVFQPDFYLRLLKQANGQSVLNENDYLVGAPELVGEVANSTASIDLHSKKTVYLEHGVKEYIVWRVRDKAIDWFHLEHEQYVRLEPEDGVIKSRIFPGLWLNTQALLADDLQAVLKTLEQGMADSESEAYRESFRKGD